METGQRISNTPVWTILLATCALGGAASETMAEDTCDVPIDQLGRWDMYEPPGSGAIGYSDVWAEGDVAYVGTWNDNVVFFVDISDAANPVRILTWSVGTPNDRASAQDVKVHDGLLFIGLEGNVSDGVEIVDVRDPFNPVHLTWISTPGYSHVHNLYYESGYLYLVGSGTTVGIVDLTTYDPDSPPARITEDHWLLTGVGSSFVHDITVTQGRLYASAWDSGLYIYDVTNIANEPPVFLGAGPPSDRTHAVWPSADGRWVVAGIEIPPGPLQLYEVIPNGDSLDIILRDSVLIPSGWSMHNPIVVGTRVYAAWYDAGVRVFDIDEQNALLVEVGSFDTAFDSGPGAIGAWGVYPLLGSDRVLASDLQNGLFILDASGNGCDDGLFCNGFETCADGMCVVGSDPCPGQLCREFDDQCVECLGDEGCDNGAFCDGPETCDAAGMCVPGARPCEQFCLEESDRCVDCLDDTGCDDSLFCTEDRCIDGDCDNSPILYGDGNLDGMIDLDDILCVLDGFAGSFERCTFATLDIADCTPDNQIDLLDILAVLDAFSGLENCCDGP